MRASLSVILFLALAAPAAAADTTPKVQGLWLTTDYPSLELHAGETSTLPLTIYNYALAPQRTTLTMKGAPADWKAQIEGDGKPVSAAFVTLNGQASLDLKLDIPSSAKPGDYKILIDAAGPDAKSELPIDITLDAPLAATLTATPQFPVLKGSPKSSFDFDVTLKNDSSSNMLINLATAAPKGFTTTFKEQYGTQELTSLPLKPGASQDMTVSVTPAPNVSAGSYPVKVSFKSDKASAETALTLDVSGQPTLSLTGEGDRLSGQAYAGKETSFPMIVSNTGSAPATNITLSATAPDGWTAEFDPKTIDSLAPNAQQKIVANITPTAQAIAGDYMVSMDASGDGIDQNASYRVTVETSTLWGVTGIVVIGAALLVLVGAVGRFGRR